MTTILNSAKCRVTECLSPLESPNFNLFIIYTLFVDIIVGVDYGGTVSLTVDSIFHNIVINYT